MSNEPKNAREICDIEGRVLAQISRRLHKSPRMTRLAGATCSLVTNPRGELLGCAEVIRPECARYKVKAKTLTMHNRC